MLLLIKGEVYDVKVEVVSFIENGSTKVSIRQRNTDIQVRDHVIILRSFL